MNTKKIVKAVSDIAENESQTKFSAIDFTSLGVSVCGEMDFSEYTMFEDLRVVAESAEYKNVCDYVKIDELAFAVQILNRLFGKELALKIIVKQ